MGILLVKALASAVAVAIDASKQSSSTSTISPQQSAASALSSSSSSSSRQSVDDLPPPYSEAAEPPVLAGKGRQLHQSHSSPSIQRYNDNSSYPSQDPVPEQQRPGLTERLDYQNHPAFDRPVARPSCGGTTPPNTVYNGPGSRKELRALRRSLKRDYKNHKRILKGKAPRE